MNASLGAAKFALITCINLALKLCILLMVKHCYGGKPWARELEWHLGLAVKNKVGSRNSSLSEECRVPLHGTCYVCGLCDYKTRVCC